MKDKSGERGYALVGLLAGMTISLIMMTAALPNVKHELQREKEEEMLWRAQQVVAAIREYAMDRGWRAGMPPIPGQFPTDLDKLVAGETIGIRKKKYLRPSALCDPLMPCAGKANWKLARPGDELIPELWAAYNKKIAEKKLLLPQPTLLAMLANTPQVALPNGLSLTENGQQGPRDSAVNDELGLKQELGPVVGVVSKSPDKMIRNYFDFETYDKALFFADLPIIAGGFFSPYFQGAQQLPSQANICPNGKIWIVTPDGRGGCYGGTPQIITPRPQ